MGLKTLTLPLVIRKCYPNTHEAMIGGGVAESEVDLTRGGTVEVRVNRDPMPDIVVMGF